MSKMKYQDKIKFVDAAVEMLKNENSREEINSYFEKEGLKSWDIEKINQSLDKHLKVEYKSRIKSYMLNGLLETKLSEFDEVDPDLFEKIQYEVIGEVKLESKEKIKQLVSQGKSEEDVIKDVVNPFFEEDAILEEIDKFQENHTTKNNQKMKGVGFIVLGMVLTFASPSIVSQGMVLFYGLIIYGIVLIFRSSQT